MWATVSDAHPALSPHMYNGNRNNKNRDRVHPVADPGSVEKGGAQGFEGLPPRFFVKF